MKKHIINTLNLGVLVHAGVVVPMANAASVGSNSNSKSSSISDAEIVARYGIAMKSKDVEASVNKTTQDLFQAGVTEKKISSSLKKAFLKLSPELYAEVNSKIQSLNANEKLSEQEKIMQIREITSGALLQAQQTGLAFTTNCDPEAKLTAAIVLGVVALAGGITALVLNKSDASIKKKYDGRRQDIISSYNDTKYSIENAEFLLTQENSTLLQSINSVEGNIRQYENDIDDAQRDLDVILNTYKILGSSITDEQKAKLEADEAAARQKMSTAEKNIIDAHKQIENITIQIAKNAQKIAYYSDPANVEFELNQAKIDFDLAIAANQQDYENALLTAPQNRKAAKWVGISSAVVAGAGVTVLLLRNAGCGDH